MKNHQFEYQGLSKEEVKKSRVLHGTNSLLKGEENAIWATIKDIIGEPMFILLTVACLVYFSTGESTEGIMMLIAIIFVSGISIFQETRSSKALKALKKYIDPKAKVLRDDELREIFSEELVVGDLIVVEEGNLIPADAEIIQCNDFSVNESILTGEAFAVDKNLDNRQLYFGTLATSGYAVARINGIGRNTELGKIGKSLENIKKEKTPLQRQINAFVRVMAAVGVVFFIIVWIINYLESRDILHGLLHGLTLAMSVLPEEIPVAFATFMALGARELMNQGILTRQAVTVESLGSATVVCVDKTGTITENKMKVTEVYASSLDSVLHDVDLRSNKDLKVLEYAMWASEVHPFDPMEVAIHQCYTENASVDKRPQYNMVHEYPLDGKPPMMTHIYESQSRQRIVAAKGGWEIIVDCCRLEVGQKEKIKNISTQMAARGYRILGVASADFTKTNFPDRQMDFPWHFEGLLALEDPPKKNMTDVISKFYDAGIDLKIVTGDYPETAIAIAKKIGLREGDKYLTGNDVMNTDADKLFDVIEKQTVFARMFPEAKLKLIEALKSRGEVVAMTGDGVNDAPALKAAHIGVAMGKKGTETAKRAASLILLHDDLQHMVDAVATGRRIYSNLKKAVQYIISIHIPIMLTVALPLMLGWLYTNIFSPIHVIFFELIMGPTCSVIFENEPIEGNQMKLKPRKMSATFFSAKELSLSIFQGLAIAAGALILYFQSMKAGITESEVRTLVFTTILLSNILLTLVNRSFYYSLFTTLKYKNRLIPLIILISLAVLAVSLFVAPVRDLFQFEMLSYKQMFISLFTSAVAVLWIEIYKWIIRMKKGRYLYPEANY